MCSVIKVCSSMNAILSVLLLVLRLLMHSMNSKAVMEMKT